MSKNAEFSIAVSGDGQFLSMFVTEGQQAFPKATWYDRSKGAQQAIAGEARLGQSGALRPADRAAAQRAGRNLANPAAADVTVTFATVGKHEKVTIEGDRKKRTASLNTNGSSPQALKRFMKDIISAVNRVR